MAIQTQQFVRKPIYVDAVRVTKGNFQEVAEWCGGEIQTDRNTKKQFIRVRVNHPKVPRQTMAFVGDWVLYTETGYKIYTKNAFRSSFDEVEKGVQTPPTPIDQVKTPVDAVVTHEIREATLHSVGPVAANPDPAQGVGEITTLRSVEDVEAFVESKPEPETTPQGEVVEFVEATPQAIADVVNEQQPEPVKVDDGIAVSNSPTAPPVEDPQGRRVLTRSEQREMTRAEVEYMVRNNEAVLEQDLIA